MNFTLSLKQTKALLQNSYGSDVLVMLWLWPLSPQLICLQYKALEKVLLSPPKIMSGGWSTLIVSFLLMMTLNIREIFLHTVCGMSNEYNKK